MFKLLLVEDDFELSAIIADKLRRYGYLVEETTRFNEIIEDISKKKPDLILLDINLPYYDGYYICRALRQNGIDTPIIIISARQSDAEHILGLELGADDFIIKPFNMDILQAKIKSCLRRIYQTPFPTDEMLINVKGLLIDKHTFTLSFKEQKIELTKNEFKLLFTLAENINKIVTREKLLSELWDDNSFVYDNTLTVNITRVKAKLSQLGIHDIIRTKRGEGYILTDDCLEEF